MDEVPEDDPRIIKGYLDEEHKQQAAEKDLNVKEIEPKKITALNPAWSSHLSNLAALRPLVSHTRNIDSHLWWVALGVKLGLIMMAISLLVIIAAGG